jgi:hypothetical protein
VLLTAAGNNKEEFWLADQAGAEKAAQRGSGRCRLLILAVDFAFRGQPNTDHYRYKHLAGPVRGILGLDPDT